MADPVTAIAGQLITYMFDVVNNGPDAAFEATIAGAFPGSATYESVTPPAGWVTTSQR